jgi:hypothetical protein
MNAPALPTVPVTSPRFKYVPAVQTNVKRTWRKARLMQHLASSKDARP